MTEEQIRIVQKRTIRQYEAKKRQRNKDIIMITSIIIFDLVTLIGGPIYALLNI